MSVYKRGRMMGLILRESDHVCAIDDNVSCVERCEVSGEWERIDQIVFEGVLCMFFLFLFTQVRILLQCTLVWVESK